MLQNVSIRNKLRLLLGILGAALLVSLATALLGQGRLHEAQVSAMDSLEHGRQAQENARQAQVAFKIQIQEWKNILLRGQDPAAFQKYREAFQTEGATVAKLLQELRGKVGEFDVPEATVDNLLKAAQTLEQEYLSALQAYAPGKPDPHRPVDAQVKGKDRELTEGIDTLVTRIKTSVEKDRNEHLGELERITAQVRTVLLTVSILGLTLGILLAMGIIQGILASLKQLEQGMEVMASGDLRHEVVVATRDELGHIGEAFNRLARAFKKAFLEMKHAAAQSAGGSTELSHAADEISSTTADIARQNEQQRSTTEQMAAAMTELSVSIEEVSTNVRRAEERTRGAVKAAEAGASQGKLTHEAMEAMAETTTQMVAAVRVIQDIARQTNLLSLNAAIEAAKAGAMGKGFAVVAEEVRKLAERSGQAAREIGQLIERSNAAMQDGRKTVGDTVTTLGTIQEHVADVSSMILEIGHAASEQARTSQEVARQVDHLAGETASRAAATTELAQTVEEISHAASDLAQVSEVLATSVRQFQV